MLIIQTHIEDNLVILYETQSFPAAEPLINYIAMEWVLFWQDRKFVQEI